MGEGSMKMAFFSSRTSLVVSNDFFSEKYKYALRTADTQLFAETLFEFYQQSQNMTTSVGIYIRWKLQTDVVRAVFSTVR